MKALQHINKYFLKYKFRLLLGILFITISNLFAIYPASIIRQVLDVVVQNISALQLMNGFEHADFLRTDLFKTIGVFSAVIMGMALLKGLFMYFMRQTIIVMSRLIEYDMKNEIFEHYQKLNLGFYKMNTTGDLMNRISEDVSRVRMYIGPAVMYTINLAVLFILVITTMIQVSPKLTLYVLTPLPLLSIAVYKVNSIILKKSEVVQEQLSKLSSFVQETFSGIRIIKAYNRLTYYGLTFEQEAEGYKEKNLSLVKLNAIFFPLIILLIGLSTIATVYVGGIEVEKGTISPGVIAEFIIYVNMLTWPVASIGWVTSMMQRASASQKRINEFLEIEPAIANPTHEVYPISGAIEFDNVSFTYPDTNITALKNVSFKVDAGKTLAILGKTGSGKSTIAQLLQRFYDVEKGSVRIDNKPIKNHNLHLLRAQIGYVPQEVFLFSDTIKNNIAFGLLQEELTEDELMDLIVKAAKDAEIYSNIMEFKQQFNTKVGERGLTLSGGQKQRISIARAIIKNPQILIFDDCLSAVDTETEEKILNNLLRIMHGKTSIIISHRISTVRNADYIIVLDQGLIIEEGTHEQLISSKGAYFEAYQKQLLEAPQVKEA